MSFLRQLTASRRIYLGNLEQLDFAGQGPLVAAARLGTEAAAKSARDHRHLTPRRLDVSLD
jgi:hypothetical protein